MNCIFPHTMDLAPLSFEDNFAALTLGFVDMEIDHIGEVVDMEIDIADMPPPSPLIRSVADYFEMLIDALLR